MASSLSVSSADLIIKSVVVYPECAIITRQWAQYLEQDTDIIFRNIPGLLDESFLRVSADGNSFIKDIIISDLPKSTKKEEDLKQNELRELEIAIAEQTRKSNILQSEIERTEKQSSAWWESYYNILRQGCASSSTHFDEEGAKNFIKYLTVYSKECEMIDQRVTDQYGHYLQLEDSISENQLNLKRKTEDMDRASGKDLVVSVTVSEPATVTMTVTYKIEAAKWIPEYDIRVNPREQMLEVSYKAIIQQNSGENWNDVHLRLANIVPHSPGMIPTEFHNTGNPPPKPRRLVTTLVDSQSLNNPPIHINGLLHDFDSGEKLNHTPIPQQTGTPPLTVVLDQQLNIPGNNSEIAVKAMHLHLPVQIIHRCMPNVSSHVYIHVTGINSSKYPLLSGTAKVFLSDIFLVKTEVPSVKSLEAFKLWLGTDPDVRTTLRLPALSNGDQGHEGLVAYVHGFQIENDRSEPINVSALWSLSDTVDENAEFVNSEESEGLTGGKIPQEVNITSHNQMAWHIKIPSQTKHNVSLILKHEMPKDTFPKFNNTETMDNSSSSDSSKGDTGEQKTTKEGLEPCHPENTEKEKASFSGRYGGKSLRMPRGSDFSSLLRKLSK